MLYIGKPLALCDNINIGERASGSELALPGLERCEPCDSTMPGMGVYCWMRTDWNKDSRVRVVGMRQWRRTGAAGVTDGDFYSSLQLERC